MSAVAWTITNPGGSGQSALAALGLSTPAVNFRVMAVSTARMVCHRDFDSADAWYEYDDEVTIYRDGTPFFTGRVQDITDSADDTSEVRTLDLADAWLDLEQIIYQEPWAAGFTTVMYPRAILGRNAAGTRISTGTQIGEVIDYAITQGASIAKGHIAAGITLWPSEIRNQSCESVILGEMRFHPDWIAWLDHTTSPVTFHARPKSALESVTVDITDEHVGAFSNTEVKRTVPRGVVITYESANTVDGEVYRATYQDTAGETTGRRIATAMVDLEGMNVSYQKSRIEVRNLPTDDESMTAWMKLKFPELAALPDNIFSFVDLSFQLAPEPTQPPPVNPNAIRIAVPTAADLPRELVKGSVEDWMRKKVGRVLVKYKLRCQRNATKAQRKVMEPFITLFEGDDIAEEKPKVISITATNAITKLYKGVSSYTAGEGRPEGVAAAMFAAATEQQYEGFVTVSKEDVPAGRWHGKKLTLRNGEAEIFSGAVIHSATMDIEAGSMTLNYGPMGWLSAGDFLDLQRILNKRPVMWMSAAERTSNELGSELSAGSKGDIVSGYDTPDTITPPGGGGEKLLRQWKAAAATATTIDCLGGTFTSQPDFTPLAVAAVTALSATESGHVILTVLRSSSTRAVTATPVISYAAGTLPESDYSSQIIPLAKVTVEGTGETAQITEILPLKFEEIHVFEDYAFANGELVLADLSLAGRNTYDPPA